MWQAQAAQVQSASHAIAYQQGQAPPPYSTTPAYASSALYPSLSDYMGLEITPDMISRHAVVPASSRQVCGLKCFMMLYSRVVSVCCCVSAIDLGWVVFTQFDIQLSRYQRSDGECIPEF